MASKKSTSLEKPESIKADAWKSKKWDELVKGRAFTTVDIPTLAMLVQWCAVLERCISDISEADGMIAYENKMGDYKPLPQIGVMKQASAEIRILNKQLGIADGKDVATITTQGKLSSILKFVQTRRCCVAWFCI